MFYFLLLFALNLWHVGICSDCHEISIIWFPVCVFTVWHYASAL